MKSRGSPEDESKLGAQERGPFDKIILILATVRSQRNNRISKYLEGIMLYGTF
jgi:hypothetical protein